MLLAILIISVLLNLVLGYAVKNMLWKLETLEDYIAHMYIQAQQALRDMRYIDETGVYESEDDVGRVFSRLKAVVEDYARFLGVEEAERAEKVEGA